MKWVSYLIELNPSKVTIICPLKNQEKMFDLIEQIMGHNFYEENVLDINVVESVSL
jgi:hypothetical protein